MSDELSAFFRDVDDHLKLVDELIALRDVLAAILPIFLPLTFITGFVGMDFGWMVGNITSLWVFLVYGIRSLAVSGVGIYLWFRRSRHIG